MPSFSSVRPPVPERESRPCVVTMTFRIEEAADVDSVLVGESTYRATHGAIEYGERRLLQARGKAEPVVVYEALRAIADLRAAHESTPLAPLVGRKEELSLILDTLARARRDRTVQLVTLMGVPGIGKSRLVWELQRALEYDPGLVTWRRGRCLPYGEESRSGRSVRWSRPRPGSWRRTTRRQRRRSSTGPCATSSPTRGRRSGRRSPAATARTRRSAGERREEAFAAWRSLFEALSNVGAARAGGRRPPLGRRWPARLPRPPGRLGDECAARLDLHGAARVARAAPDVGSAGERGRDRARTAERPRDGCARRLSAAPDARG